MSNTNTDIVVGYNKNDFLYVLSNNMPTKETCNDTYYKIVDENCIPNISADSSWNTDFSYNCLQKERCKNRENAESLYKLQNDHLGSDGKYEDTQKLYKNEYMKTIHLSIGIIGILTVLFYSK